MRIITTQTPDAADTGKEDIMKAQDLLQMLRDMRDVSFATVDAEGRPQNRIIDVMLVEEGRLYFCTGRGKDFYHQLAEDGYVAVAGLNKDWQMVRLTGQVKKPDDQKKWIDRIFDENPSMNDVYPGDARYILDPFVIDNGELEFFDLGKHPIHREYFRLESNDAVEPDKGFRISDGCIGCGVCRANCPQQCIDSGTPYSIRQDSCLHCGLCYENCPVQAIERLGH